MLKKHFLAIAAILAVVITLYLEWTGRSQMPDNRPHYALSNVTITHSDGNQIAFKAEVAITPAEQAYGLMFITSLPEDQAMIFPYSPAREVAFWMKNTLIPLDMLFVGSNGAIGAITENARPQDITPIDSQIPVVAVIEIGGGLAAKDGIKVGDKITSPALTP